VGLCAVSRARCPAGVQRGSMSAAVSYDAPSVSAAGVSNVASSGGVSVSVVGRGGMGVSGSSGGARLGLSACEGSGWVSDSGVVCKAAGGVSGGAVGVVSAGVVRGSASVLLSYDAPSVSAAGVSNVASSGGVSVTVAGRGGAGASGASSKVLVGGSACVGSVWQSDSGVVCRSASGGFPDRPVAVSCGRQHGSASRVLSYNAPVVSSAGLSNAASSGGMSLTVAGRGGLGSSAFSATASVGVSGCAASVWRSDSGLVCRSAGGMRGGAAVLVSSGVQRGSVSAAVSYDAPSVSAAGVSNVASSGAMSVSVSGRGMGVGGLSAVGGVGGSACGASVWRSDSGLVCRVVSGCFSGQVVLVSSGVQRGSVSAAVSYDAPSVSSAALSNVATSGVASVTVVGGGFAVYGASSAGRALFTAASATLWISGSSVVARCGAGLGAAGSVVVSVGLQGGV
jgi:hypothetical protein